MEQRAAAGVLRPACELANSPLRASQRVALCRRSRAACQGRGGRRCPSGRADRNVHSLFLSFSRPARVSFEEPGPAPARERPRLHRPNRVELPCSEHRRAHRSLRPPTAEAERVEEAHFVRGRHPLGDRVMLAELCVLFSVLVRIGVGNNRVVQRNRSDISCAVGHRLGWRVEEGRLRLVAMQQTTIALNRRERVVEHACVQTCRLFAVEEVHAGAQHDHVRMVCTRSRSRGG